MTAKEEAEVRIEELKRVLSIINNYKNKDWVIASIEGRIDGYNEFLNNLKGGYENGKRNIL